jgi:hypothetical protein
MSYRLRKEKDGELFTYPLCTHYATKQLDKAASLADDEGNSLTGGRRGIEVEMTFPAEGGGVYHDSIILPDDADKVYVMNAGGDTIDTIKYPPSK